MKRILSYFLDAIIRFPGRYAVSFALSVLCAMVLAVVPWILQSALSGLDGSSPAVLCAVVLCFAAILLVSVFAEIQKYISLDRFGGEYISSLLARLEKAILDLDEIEVRSLTQNQLDHILYADILDVFRVVGNFLPGLSSSVLVICLLLAGALLISPRAAVFLLAACLAGILISYYSGKKVRSVASRTNEMMKKLHRHLENFSHSPGFIRINGLDDYYLQKTADCTNDFIQSSISEDRTVYFYSGLISRSQLLIQLCFSLLLSLVLADDAAGILVYTLIFDLAMNEASGIAQLLQQINRSSVCFENIDRLLKTSERGKKRRNTAIDRIESLEIDIDSFSYQKGKKILSGLHFVLKPGDSVLIKGSNGTGKSTLVKILTNLIRSYEGSVRINGIDIRELDPRVFSSRLLYIAQNDVFLDESIKEYLAAITGKEHLSEEQLRTLFARLDLKLEPDTRLDITGSMLSGGQKKKLQLARLLLSGCENKIIILDEAEAGLDGASRSVYQAILNRIIDQKSNILILIQHSDCTGIHLNRTIVL